ncbi:MAG: extracellular solute-binding protein [Alicyclobacillus sp.]|nr:extracellular solute-binding protein [Alicyclobacillus sp.]
MKKYGMLIISTLTGLGGLSAIGSVSAAPSNNVINIITWMNPPAVKALEQIDSEFEKANPGYVVHLQATADVSGPYATAQQTAVQGGTADIMSIMPFQPLPAKMNEGNLTPTQNWAVHGEFVPLNNQPWVKNYNSEILSNAAYNGKLYGFVTGAYQAGVFYNKDIFAKYHISVPKTFHQFMNIAKVLSSHHVVPFYDGLQNVGPSNLQWFVSPLFAELWLPKVHNVNTALWNGKATWTDPAFIEIENREKSIMQYLEPNFTGVSWQSMPGALANGKAAMMLGGSFDVASMMAANPHLRVGYFPLPGSDNPKDNQSVLYPDLTFVVLNNSPHKAAALKWLSFFASPKIYEQYVNITGISPSAKSGSYSSVTSKVLGAYFGKGVSVAAALPQLPASGSYWVQPAHWWELQLEMFEGKYTPQQAAQMYETAWSASLR